MDRDVHLIHHTLVMAGELTAWFVGIHGSFSVRIKCLRGIWLWMRGGTCSRFYSSEHAAEKMVESVPLVRRVTCMWMEADMWMMARKRSRI